MAEMKHEHWTKDEIEVAVQSWLSVRVELMALNLLYIYLCKM